MAKSKTRPFAGIPNRVMEHADFHALSANSVRLLLWFAYQYKGNNNGKLCAVHSQLCDKGFKSKSTLSAELSKGSGLGKNGRTPNYYALTYESVDEIRGFEMDLKPTNKALRTFIDDIDNKRCA